MSSFTFAHTDDDYDDGYFSFLKLLSLLLYYSIIASLPLMPYIKRRRCDKRAKAKQQLFSKCRGKSKKLKNISSLSVLRFTKSQLFLLCVVLLLFFICQVSAMHLNFNELHSFAINIYILFLFYFFLSLFVVKEVVEEEEEVDYMKIKLKKLLKFEIAVFSIMNLICNSCARFSWNFGNLIDMLKEILFK